MMKFITVQHFIIRVVMHLETTLNIYVTMKNQLFIGMVDTQ